LGDLFIGETMPESPESPFGLTAYLFGDRGPSTRIEIVVPPFIDVEQAKDELLGAPEVVMIPKTRFDKDTGQTVQVIDQLTGQPEEIEVVKRPVEEMDADMVGNFACPPDKRVIRKLLNKCVKLIDVRPLGPVESP
jgi:hypothetical protein